MKRAVFDRYMGITWVGFVQAEYAASSCKPYEHLPQAGAPV